MCETMIDYMEGWSNDFFTSAWGQLMSEGWADEVSELETKRLVSLLRLQEGNRVLDLPCGTGRHAIRLALYGLKVTAVDGCLRALATAAYSAKNAKAPVDFVLSDMREYFSDQTFDAAFCYWGSFGYFSDQENRTVISNIAGSLREGGMFLLNTHSLETLRQKYPDIDQVPYEITSRVKGLVAREVRSFDAPSGRLSCSIELEQTDGGVPLKKLHCSIRIYALAELASIFDTCGLRIVDIRDGQRDGLFTTHSQYATLVCNRRQGN